MKTLLVLTMISSSTIYSGRIGISSTVHTPTMTSQVLDMDYWGCIKVGKKFEKYETSDNKRYWECTELSSKDGVKE